MSHALKGNAMPLGQGSVMRGDMTVVGDQAKIRHSNKGFVVSRHKSAVCDCNGGLDIQGKYNLGLQMGLFVCLKTILIFLDQCHSWLICNAISFLNLSLEGFHVGDLLSVLCDAVSKHDPLHVHNFTTVSAKLATEVSPLMPETLNM